MLDIVLYQPEIPPNTGNIIRLCANTGCRLHLIEPLGFALDDKQLQRAGLDYHEWTEVRTHSSLEDYQQQINQQRLLTFTTRGTRLYTEITFQPGDALLFGPETRGLPKDVLNRITPEYRLRLPMVTGNRSLNLSNVVAVVVYEAWRQLGFKGSQL